MKKYRGHTLNSASENGRLEIVKHFVKKGADVTDNGNMQKEVVKYLLKHGATLRRA